MKGNNMDTPKAKTKRRLIAFNDGDLAIAFIKLKDGSRGKYFRRGDTDLTKRQFLKTYPVQIAMFTKKTAMELATHLAEAEVAEVAKRKAA
jgi:hypothetical protein